MRHVPLLPVRCLHAAKWSAPRRLLANLRVSPSGGVSGGVRVSEPHGTQRVGRRGVRGAGFLRQESSRQDAGHHRLPRIRHHKVSGGVDG